MKLIEARERFKRFGQSIRTAPQREPLDRDRANPRQHLHLLNPTLFEMTYCGRNLKLSLMESVSFRFTDSVNHFDATTDACRECLAASLLVPASEKR